MAKWRTTSMPQTLITSKYHRRVKKKRPSPPRTITTGKGHLGRYETTRTADDYKQAGERYRTFEEWEREDLIAKMITDLKHCPKDIAPRMTWHSWYRDENYGRRVPQGLGMISRRPKRCRCRRESRHPARTGGQVLTRAVSPKRRSRAQPFRLSSVGPDKQSCVVRQRAQRLTHKQTMS
jgi:hypothetical protein